MIKCDCKTTCYTCGHFYLLQTSDIYYKMYPGNWGRRYDPPPVDEKHYYFFCPTCQKEVEIHKNHLSPDAAKNAKTK